MARLCLVLFSIVVCSFVQCAKPRGTTDRRIEPEVRIERILAGLRPSGTLNDTTFSTFTLDDRMAHYNVPGVSIAVIHEGRINWARGYGAAEVGTEQVITAQTLFQAASISKPLTALAVMVLVEQGKLHLDRDVNEVLKAWKLPENEFKADKNVTLTRLLSHTGGINVSSFPGYARGEIIPTLLDVLNGTPPANTKPIRVILEPDSDWRYSGGGYCIIQQLMVEITGEGFPELMTSLVLQPLVMQNSTFEQPLPAELLSSAAMGHNASGEVVPGGWHTYPEMAAAGLWTTPADLARFAMGIEESVAGGKKALVSTGTIEHLATPRFGSFSLGLLVRGAGTEAWFTNNGGNEGYRCLLYAYVRIGEGAVVMTNSDNGMELAQEIINAIATEYQWPNFEPEF
ncbi:MAG: beta-lactamase family protein [Fidelibacterota bacterium]|nr:MAG: beta-lactamase family protein [Candidatus Neomarinimicrobiota bacterium]